VPSKTKPLSAKELAEFEAGRDLGAELLQSIREMKADKVRVAFSPTAEAREKTGLSLVQFAALLDVSVRTLQGWKQGRKQPSGAARSLLSIARTIPQALLTVVGSGCPVRRKSKDCALTMNSKHPPPA
jgi:putative transcriptional regulator